MSDRSYFESRTGKLSCNSKEVYIFVTDIRNFERFIPAGALTDWHVARDSCNFSVPMLGTVHVRLLEKEMNRKVRFTGDAFIKDDFSLTLNISERSDGFAEVKVFIDADINPMIKMMATKPINAFLEKLICEMESFRAWNDIKE
jgi:carbon monoxide dehydrogenase subunit G